MAATSTIPIVFVSATDPVVMKIVTSLNRPGGNITGVSLLGVALEAKRLELLHAIVPNASTLAALINPGYPGAKMQVEELQEAAARLGVKLITFGASTAADIDDAFAALARQGAGGLLAAQDPLVLTRRDQVTGLAARYAIPVIFALREIVVEGGLMSYGAVFSNGYYQGGIDVGKILKGASPADLPVLQPTKFEFVINLKTAKALGVAIPDRLLATADEVIE